MKAIITGATGGLGRNLGEFLNKKNWEVIGFGRNKKIGNSLGYKFKAFDLSDPDETLKAFEKADVVFHCAALSSPWGKYEDFFKHNVIATKNVITAIKKYEIKKLIHVSTPSIYFNFSDQRDIKETYLPKKFVNHYAKTKYLAEQEVLNSDIDSVIIRPRGIFGEYDSVLIPRLEKIAAKGFLPVIKEKNPLVDVTYVGNVVYSMYLAAIKKTPEKSVFNITNDESMHIYELFEMVMKTLNKQVKFKKISYNKMMTIAKTMEFFSKIKITKEPLITQYGVGLIAFDQTLCIQNAKNILNYEPKYSIKEGLERYARSKYQTL
ncbi:NAD-dependent epimerase/dehydratase family protein [Caminibacter pacificus]|jgi:nucleoside-diphosphate-sugar epimerase